MFLAINEIKDAKLRYSLIVGLLTLVSYLMFFLSGLAFGLIDQNRSSIDHWKADTVLLSSEANKTLALSNLKLSDKSSISADNVEPFSQMLTVSNVGENTNNMFKQKISIFGVNKDSFLIPSITKGKSFESKNEIVIDKSISEKSIALLSNKALLYLSYTSTICLFITEYSLRVFICSFICSI